MAGREPPDVRADAYRHADAQIRKAMVAKGAGSGAVPDRDVLAALYAAVLEAVHDHFGTGPYISWSGDLVAKSARRAGIGEAVAGVGAGMAAAGKLLKKNAKSAKKLGKKLERFAAAERARVEAEAAHMDAIRKMATPAPAFTPVDQAMAAKAQFIMGMLRTADEQQQVSKIDGHGTKPGQEGTSANG